jgi:hypothetical protein
MNRKGDISVDAVESIVYSKELNSFANSYCRAKMLAFCFMSTGDVNNAGAWAKFFSGGLFGINYILLMHRTALYFLQSFQVCK